MPKYRFSGNAWSLAIMMLSCWFTLGRVDYLGDLKGAGVILALIV